MKKRKMSYRTARLVLESAEVQVPVEVDQQYNIVTAMDGIELNPGTMVNVIKITDKQIEFKVVDTESTYSTDYDTFVAHCQLQSNNVNESFVDESIDKAKVSKLVGSIYDYGNEGHEQKLIPIYKKIAKRANLENADYKKIISAANEEELQDLYKVAMSQAKAIAKAEKYSGVSDSDRDKMKALLEKEFVNECDESVEDEWDSMQPTERSRVLKRDGWNMSDIEQVMHKKFAEIKQTLQNEIIDALDADEALSPAGTTRLTAIINNTYAMVNYAHVLHNNDFDAPNVNAVHLALETLYTELPALADELGEACRFDFDITLDHTVVINEANPVKACFDLRNDLLSLQKDMPGYINSMIDAINGLLTSVMYKMVRLGGLTKPTIVIVTEAKARGWSEYSVQEKLNALKLAIMSDGLAYDAEDYVGKDLKDMPKELQAALEVVTAVNESANNDRIAAKVWASYSNDERKRIAKLAGRESDINANWQKMLSDVQSDLKRIMVSDGDLKEDECDESEAQDAYREFFRAKLEEFGAKSPAELSEDQKKDFFNQIKAEWPDAKAEMLNESKESDEANKVAFARAYADCNDIKKIQKIDEILLKAGQRVSTSIDVAFAAVKPEVQKELCNVLGIEWTNESINYAKVWEKSSRSLKSDFLEHSGLSLDDERIKDALNTDQWQWLGGPMKNAAKEGIDHMNMVNPDKIKKLLDESIQHAKGLKRSVIAALKYVNEELEVGAELKCLKDLVTTDGTVIPAKSTVSYTGIDSNTNVATVTFGENSYAVTIPDLTAATQQMGPAI